MLFQAEHSHCDQALHNFWTTASSGKRAVNSVEIFNKNTFHVVMTVYYGHASPQYPFQSPFSKHKSHSVGLVWPHYFLFIIKNVRFFTINSIKALCLEKFIVLLCSKIIPNESSFNFFLRKQILNTFLQVALFWILIPYKRRKDYKIRFVTNEIGVYLILFILGLR